MASSFGKSLPRQSAHADAFLEDNPINNKEFDDDADRPVLNASGVCRLLMVTPNRLSQLVKQGLPAIGESDRRFHREAILRWLERQSEFEAAQRLALLTTETDGISAADGGAATGPAR